MVSSGDMKALRELSKNFSRGRNLGNKIITYLPTSNDPDHLKRFAIKENYETILQQLPEIDKEVLEESSIFDAALASQELTVENYKQQEYETIGKKIIRLERRKERHPEDTPSVDKKITYLITKAEKMENMSPNWWASQTRKEAQKIWLGSLMELGSLYNQKKENLRQQQQTQSE